uniref:Ubiquitin-like protease family profile domain-containing protein n=1 Tax=Glossina pallidipes TaxID=7398 RepID=A0A1A9ZPS9_GLOPL
MSDDPSLTFINKPALRKSIFRVPEIDHKLIKNTTYADIEFFDDDEDPIAVKDLDEKPSCSTANRFATKVYNISINHPSEDRLKFQAKQAHLVLKLLPTNHMSYTHGCRQQLHGNMICRRATGSSICSSEASTSSSARFLIGLNHIPTTPWPSTYRSILTQERENEEREKYKQLLKQVMRSMSSNNRADPKRKRSAMLVATANSSAGRSSSANTRPLGLPSMNFRRPQISSTINLDDDDDDGELTFAGVSNNRASVANKIKAEVSTVIIDDVSGIIDLGNDGRPYRLIPTWRCAAEVEIQERLRTFPLFDPELLGTAETELIKLTQEHNTRLNAAICGPKDVHIFFLPMVIHIPSTTFQQLTGVHATIVSIVMCVLYIAYTLVVSSLSVCNSWSLLVLISYHPYVHPQGGIKAVVYTNALQETSPRKVDIFARDILPVPVHVGGIHWCMAIIYLKDCTIKYYNSMGIPNSNVLKALEQYLKDESMDKRKQPFDTSQFIMESVPDVPRQMNGSNCGVFSCMFADFLYADFRVSAIK